MRRIESVITNLVFGIAMSGCACAGQVVPKLVDLSIQSEGPSFGYPGRSAGGAEGVPTKKPIDLPVTVTILQIVPQRISVQEKFNVDVEVKNIGEEPIKLPASPRFSVVGEASGAGRRFLSFGIFDKSRSDGHSSVAGGLSFGIEQDPLTMVTLGPGDRIQYRVGGWFAQYPKGYSPPVARIALKGELTESFLLNDGYVVEEDSATIRSKNEVTIILRDGRAKRNRN